jgi:copper resistance protein B
MLVYGAAFAAQAQEHDEHAQHAAAPKPAAQAEAAQQEAAHAHHHHDQMPSPAPAQAADHVAPDPPQYVMAPMTDAQMIRTMRMDDDASLFKFKLDTFERARGDEAYSTAWNAQAWYGGDFDKLWLRSEGTRQGGVTQARIEAFWNHAFASHWDWQLGLRRDFGSGPSRDWAAFGVQGLAPYWFEVEATAYLGANGRTAFGLRAEYELLLTQRLILQPEAQFNLYARNDPLRGNASGLNDVEFGLRLRYEIRREFAPYLGVVRKYRRHAENRDIGFDRSETQLVAGLRLWF